MADILIVDDELGMRQFLTLLFQKEGHRIRTAESGRQALTALRERTADLIISDLKMPDMDGIELLREARSLLADVAVVMMTAFGTEETAREAKKLGADDFIEKPFDNDYLKEIVARALERQNLRRENQVLKEELHELGSLDNIIGRSERMQAVYQMIKTVAEVQATVLITGESGTGKELVARAIHNLSPRADKPFVSINCGAFTETLLESELFGYVKGAFTGAASNRKGLFEAANRGTIFLDEIGEMSPAMQVKLLRVLQERKVRPVGSHEEETIDARVIAATNRDLVSMVKDNTFREDLFYRVSVIPIELPPLRERIEDVEELAEHFIRKFTIGTGRTLALSERALRLLETYPWPGNVRELENTIERAVALERSDTIETERLPEHISARRRRFDMPEGIPEDGIDLVGQLEQLEKSYVLEALRRTEGNQTRAADLLRINVRSLRHLLDKHGIRNLTAQLRDSASRSVAK
jgi:two-component system response regulator PilR (NtrC family)